MPIKKSSEFFLKGLLAMMLALLFYILGHLRHIRFTHGKRPITILPPTPTQRRERLVNPFRGAAFEQLEHLAERYARRRAQYKMHVIFDPADRERYKTMLARNPAQVRSDTWLNIRREPPLTILSAEDDVIMEAGIRVRHGSPQWFWKHRALFPGSDQPSRRDGGETEEERR